MEVITICLIIAVLTFTIVAVRLSVNISCAEEDAEQYTDKQINTVKDELRRLERLLTCLTKDSLSPFVDDFGFPDIQRHAPLPHDNLLKLKGEFVLVESSENEEHIVGKVIGEHNIVICAEYQNGLLQIANSYAIGDIYCVKESDQIYFPVYDTKHK